MIQGMLEKWRFERRARQRICVREKKYNAAKQKMGRVGVGWGGYGGGGGAGQGRG